MAIGYSTCRTDEERGKNAVNLELKIALIRRFGSQVRAAKPLKIDEPRLSKLVNGHRDPTAEERRRLTVALGTDYFAPDGNELRTE